jgi:hypothetical protein
MYTLPMTVPPFQTIPCFSQGLSILYANNKDLADNWVVNNCVSLQFIHIHTQNETAYLSIEPHFVIFNSSLLETYKIPLSFYDDFSPFISRALKDNYYVCASVDVFYLPCHEAGYKNIHIVHPILVYGINEKDELLVADHFIAGSGKFSLSIVSYEDFYQGLISAHNEYSYQNYFSELYITRYNHNKTEHSVDLFVLKRIIENFLNSEVVAYYPNNLDILDRELQFGYKGLTGLVDYLSTVKALSNEHIRLLHELYTHFSIVNLMIKKANCTGLIEASDDVVKKSLLLRNSLSISLLRRDVLKKDTISLDVSLLQKLIDKDFYMLSEVYSVINRST